MEAVLLTAVGVAIAVSTRYVWRLLNRGRKAARLKTSSGMKREPLCSVVAKAIQNYKEPGQSSVQDSLPSKYPPVKDSAVPTLSLGHNSQRGIRSSSHSTTAVKTASAGAGAGATATDLKTAADRVSTLEHAREPSTEDPSSSPECGMPDKRGVLDPNSSDLASRLTMSAFKYVVLGGGNSAGYAGKQFLESGLKPGELAIIGEEPVVSYERPALSKAYLTIDGGPRLPGFHTCVGGGGERQTPDWYKEKGITFMTSTKVTSADVKTKTLCLANGGKVTYEKLIIATGARVIQLTEFKTPGAELGGIYYLRDEADGAKLVEAMKAVKAAGGKAVVVGGGYIGMEVAAQLASNGIPSTIVMPEDRLLARLFTPELAAFYESYYQSKLV
eukprot:gene19363-26011_t